MLELPAPAKINLHLAVTGKTVNGYHTLDTSFIYVNISDSLLIEHANALHVTCSDPTLNTRDNLVFRVLEGMRNTFHVKQGLKVHIKKTLPMQAGLGGGSSNAATAIIAANALWSLNLDSKTLIEFATPFGADIPCFLFGHASRATGVGECLEPLNPGIANKFLVLAHPGVGLSTADVFSRYDKALETNAVRLTPFKVEDTMQPDFIGRTDFAADREIDFPLGKNALENVACEMCPELATLLQYMRNHAKHAWMSGSGTACIAMLEDVTDAQRLVRGLDREKLAVWKHVCNVLTRHPLYEKGPKPDDWGVAKW